MQLEKITDKVFVIHNFMSAEECEEYIEWSEQKGYDEAKVGYGKKQVMNKMVRNNERIIYDSQEMANELWRRLEPFAPKETIIGTACGINERFRFYKYKPGQRFKPHIDGSFIRNINEWSSYTFMVYLNDVEDGGATIFNNTNTKVLPETGKALIFFHKIMHEGEEVRKGLKYVLRSDVMYQRKSE